RKEGREMCEEALMACAWKGTLVLIAAFGLCGAMRKASAAARGLVWTVAFAALLALPVLTLTPLRWTAPAPAVFGSRVPISVLTKAAPIERALDWMLFLWIAGAALV